MVRISLILLLILGNWLSAFEDKNVLFIRGGVRSGGFLEAGNDAARTEQLADVYNDSTSNGNHGWAELRQTLENFGFWVYQDVEFSETTSGPAEGRALDLTTLDLDNYDVIIMGSNNAVYDSASIDALEQYIRGGGSALFISDANFGGSWADAPRSDQQFLDRFGLVVNQDQGTYSLIRDEDDFLVPDHPVLTGVDRFDGEGVSPFVVEQENLAEGVSATIGFTTIEVLDGYSGWLSLFFNKEQSNDPSISGSNIDFDHDGFLNGMEYLLLGDPTFPDDSTAPVVELIDGHLALTYWARSVGDPFLAVAEVSNGLAPDSWLSGAAHLETEVLEQASSHKKIRVTDRTPYVSENPRFMRLSIVAP